MFKKGDKQEASNYRPISLTNVDYKILAYVLTARIELCLDTIIHPSQTAYMQGHFIGTNIKKVQDAIDYNIQYNKDWVFVFLDFQKAFDSVSHIFLFSLLYSMGFPAEYITWVLLMYTKAQSIVHNKGWYLEIFLLGRGVQQGCPLSCHLFNLVG